MTLSSRYIKSIRVAFALVVFLGSTGATTVVHLCNFVAMDCCAPPPSTSHDGCGQSDLPASTPALKDDFTCHTDRIVGGVALKQGLLDKENKPQQKKASPAFILPSSLDSSNPLQAPTRSLFAFVASHSPPSVEKYVLNASFLI